MFVLNYELILLLLITLKTLMFFLLNIYMTISVPTLVKFVHGVQVFYSYKQIEERVDYNCCTWISTILAYNIRVFFRILRL